jgi:hydrogenase maturation protease
MKNILVAGLGSVLMGDDAAGPHVIAHLQKHYEMPENVTLSDLGTPGLGLTSSILGYDTIIFVDTVHDEGAPGEIHRYNKEQLMQMPINPRMNPHDPAVGEALMTAEMSLTNPEDVLLIGIVPVQCVYGIGISPAVEKAIIPAAEMVIEALTKFGSPPKKLLHGNANRIDFALSPFLEYE